MYEQEESELEEDGQIPSGWKNLTPNLNESRRAQYLKKNKTAFDFEAARQRLLPKIPRLRRMSDL